MSQPQPVPAPMPPIQATLWERLRYTPLRDALGGRLTARLDVRRAILAAELPEPLAGLVYRVVRRTRLWRSEQMDVARELAAHFRDGLDAGLPAERLAEQFGDGQLAARLIRRAKVRGRGWPWQAWRWTVRGVAALVAVIIAAYAVLAARYWTARPTIARDFLAEISAASEQVPADERAWPLYREARLKLQMPSQEVLAALKSDELPRGPADERWTEMTTFVQENQTTLALIREGAARRHLGFVFHDPADREFYRLALGREPTWPENEDRSLVATPLSHAHEIRWLQMLLAADARRAIAEADGPALLSDIEASLALAEQVHASASFLIEDLVALACFNQAVVLVGEALAERPDLLTDADLRRLAHRTASFAGGGTLRLRLEGERLVFQDLCQRMYTDDGAGDGRLTPEGVRLLSGVDAGWGEPWSNRLERDLVGVGASAVLAGRREMLDMALRLLDRFERETAGPLWSWSASDVMAELNRLQHHQLQGVRYLPIVWLLPASQYAAAHRELAAQRRDALLAAIAMELHRRRTGAWPPSLDELVPDLLPAVPQDRFTGQPLSYRVVDGQPLLYSRGPDGRNDGGAALATAEQQGWLVQGAVGRLDGPAGGGPPAMPAADWILWPPRALGLDATD